MKHLEELFGSDLKYTSRPYEVVRSLGFELAGKNESGAYCTFHVRLDVVRRLGSSSYQVVVWEANTDIEMDALLLLKSATLSTIRESDPDAAAAAAISFLDSLGSKPE
jgi:hypothetical protein